MKHRKISMLLVMVLLFVTFFTACGTTDDGGAVNGGNDVADSGEQILRVWHHFTTRDDDEAYDAYDVMRHFKEQFEEMFPNFTVEYTVKSVDNIRDTIRTALLAGSGPDVWVYDSGPGYLGVIANAGQAMNLDPYVERFGWDTEIAEWALEGCRYNGNLYGIGHELEFLGVFYNRAIFAEHGLEAPETWDEFMNIVETLDAAGVTPIGLTNQEQWPGFHYESLFVNITAGDERIGRILEGYENWDQPELAEGLDLFYWLIESGFTNADPLAIGYDDLNTQFYAGQFAMHMTGTWMVQGMELNMGDDVGIFVLPPYNDGIRAGAPGGLGAAVIVAAETEHPEEALEFLNLMFKRENADIWFRRSLIPPHVDLEVDEAAKSELFLDAIEIAEYATGFNIDVLMPQNVNEVTMNNMQRLMAGMMTGMEALQSKQQTWEEYLADN